MSGPKREQLIRIVRTPRLRQDVTAFVVDRRARGLSGRTIQFYQDELDNLLAYLDSNGVQDVGSVTANLLRSFLLDLGQRRNPGGVHAAYRAMRAFFNWYEQEYEPQDWTNPVRKVVPPKVPREQLDPVSVKDLQAMIATCKRHELAGDRDRAILYCLLDTGCRASEFCSLDIGDVNLVSGVVIVRKGKGGKFRTAFLGAKARRELVRYLRHRADTKPGEPLWVTVTCSRLTYSGLRQVVRRRALAAGVSEPSLHSFRRAFCLAMLRNGADVVSLSRLMGHQGIGLVMRYAKQVEDDLRREHEQHGPVDRLF